MVDTDGRELTCSVIVPVYNASAFLPDAIASVLSQTLTDFELIVVDDASTDDSLEVLREIAATTGDDRLRILTSASNGGVGAARNRGLAEARGHFVSFFDADDRLHPEFLKRLTDPMLADDTIDVAVGRYRYVRPDGTTLDRPEATARAIPGQVALVDALLDTVSCFLWDKVYRRSVFDGLSFPTELKVGFEDVALTIGVMARARQVWIDSEVLYDYQIHAASLTWSKLPTRQELELALSLIHASVPDRLSNLGGVRRALTRRDIILTLVLAQRAIMRPEPGPLAAETIASARDDIRLKDACAIAPIDPFTAAAALGLKVCPPVYAAFYRRFVGRRYLSQE